MKSIKQQYIDLMEGKMSQHNFMRSLRMTLPQYVTNVTSFKDSVRILKNKGILSENHDNIVKEVSDGRALDVAKKLKDEYQMDEEAIYVYLVDDMGLDNMTAQSVVDQLFGGEDDSEDEEFIDMIARAKEEEEAGKYKFDDFEGGLSEAENTSLRNPNMAAKIVAQKHNAKLQAVQSDFKQFEREAIQLAGEEMLASGMDKVAIRNLLSGYGSFEDWIPDYIDALTAELGNPEDEAPEDYEDPDMFDAYGMDASEGKLSEGKKKKEPKKELHPNQIHPQELRMGIKVELEHTDGLDKAKKIALDHLAENPFYYTALKLSGIESPSAPKAKAPKAAKKEKTAEAELVDKENAMKPVKGFEKAKASSNKAKKETNSGVKGVSELTHNAQSVRGLQKFAATGGKMKTVKSIYEAKFNAMPGEEPNATVQHAMDFIQSNPVLRQISDLITLQNDGENAILRYDYYKALPDEAYNKLELQFFVEDDFEGSDEDGVDDFETSGGTQSKIAYILYPKKKAGNLGASLEMGASKASKMDAFKESLEKLVREVLDEMYDGRDNLDETDGSQEIEKKINTGEIDPAKVKAAAEKAMKGDSTDLALLMAFGK